MPLNSDTCIAHSSITGCENRLRSKNPAKRLFCRPLTDGERTVWNEEFQGKAKGPEVDFPSGWPPARSSQEGDLGLYGGFNRPGVQTVGSRLSPGNKPDTENTQWSV